MAIINTYPKATPKGADLLIGTQVKDDNITENSTKSFSVSSIGSLLITSNDITTGSGTTNTLPVWTDGPNGVLGDSLITQTTSPDVVTIGSRFIVSPNSILGLEVSQGAGKALVTISDNLKVEGTYYDSAGDQGTNGDVLLAKGTAGNMVTRWTSLANADIASGSGTTNTLPLWSDGPNGVLGDSMITQNSSGTIANVTGRLAVDTDLAVNGYARFSGQVQDGTNSPGTNGQVLISNVSGVEWTSDIDIDGSAEFNYQLATASSAGGAARAFIEIYSTGPSKFKIYRNGPPNPTGDGYARFKIDRTYDYGNEDQMIQEVIYQKRATTTNVKFKYDGDVDTTDDVYLEFYELPDGSTEAWVCCDDFAYSMVTIFYFESLDTIYPEPVAGTPTGTLIHSTNPDTETPNWDTYKGTGYFSDGVVLESPNGTKYKITVDNSGILSTTAV